MKTYFVYILKCSDDSYYTGITNDIIRRFEEHQSGKNKRRYTFFRRPLSLAWFETFGNVEDAIHVEKQIKGWSRRKKEALMNGEWNKLVEYSKSYGSLTNDPSTSSG